MLKAQRFLAQGAAIYNMGRGYWGDLPKASPGVGKEWKQVMRYELWHRLTEACGLTLAYANKVIEIWPDELIQKGSPFSSDGKYYWVAVPKAAEEASASAASAPPRSR